MTKTPRSAAQGDLYEDQFSEAHDTAGYEGERKFLVLCSTGRSGSHMVGHILHNTGAFGYPLEYFNRRNLAEWERRLNVRGVRDVTAALMERRTSPNGVFGIKVHYSQLSVVGGMKGLLALFPGARFVLIHRLDSLGQAISLAKAQQTKVWIHGQRPVADARYDGRAIHAALRSVLRDTAAWRHDLAVFGRPMLDLRFEDAASDPRGTVAAIAAYLDITLSTEVLDRVAPGTRAQRDVVNDDWRTRFLEEYGSAPFDAPALGVGRRVLSRVRRWARSG